MTDILHIENLKTYFYRAGTFIRAVDGVSFRVLSGGAVGLAGESGSGKSQTALSVAGLTTGKPGIIGGQIRFGEEDLLDGLDAYVTIAETEDLFTIKKDISGWEKVHQRRMARLRGDRMAMVFQEPKGVFDPYFSIGDQLKETVIARFGQGAGSDYMDRTIPLLQKLKFPKPQKILKRYPHELSGGESQRVALALALIGQPGLLIADEPTTSLDAVIRRNVLDTLAEVREDANFALLLISHHLGVLARTVDHIVVLFAGQVVEQGPTTALIAGDHVPHHPYTKILLDAARLEYIEGTSNAPTDARRNESGCPYYHRCFRRDEAGLNRCKNERPPAFKIEGRHEIACWLYQT